MTFNPVLDFLDYLIKAIAVLYHWRVSVPLVLSILLAALLVDQFDWFSGWYGILVVIASFAAGIVWQARYEEKIS